MYKVIVEIKEDGNIYVYSSIPAELEIVDLRQIKQDATDGALDFLYRNTTPEKVVEMAEKHLTNATTGLIAL